MSLRPKILLTNPYPFAESVGVYGEPGVGKTRIAFSWANRCPELHFHVIDCDVRKSYQRMLHLGYPHLAAQFTIHEPRTWPEFVEAMEKLPTVSGADALNHVLVVDSATWVWDAAQNGYSQRVHEKGIEEYAMELRKAASDAKEYAAMKSNDGFWNDVTVLHRTQFYDRLTQWPGHLILTAEADATNNQYARDAKTDEEKAMATYGYKARAQKRWPYVPKTVLLLQKVDRAKWTMTTIKDMEREQVERVEVEDWAVDYLQEIAGWRPRVNPEASRPMTIAGALSETGVRKPLRKPGGTG